MQRFGKGFGEAVGERLEHDRAVVVVIVFELLFLHVHAEARGDREHADVVGHARILRRDEVGERAVRPHHAVDDRPHALLAQVAPGQRDFRARFVGVDLDVVVVHRVGRAAARSRRWPCSQRPCDQALRASPCRPRTRLRAASPTISSFRIAGIRAGQVPGLEERTPVDVVRELVPDRSS